MPLPAWLASIVHVPAPTKLTVAPEIVQTAALAGLIAKVTGLPEPPPTALTLYGGPPTMAELGAVEGKAMACPFLTTIVWTTGAPVRNMNSSFGVMVTS